MGEAPRILTTHVGSLPRPRAVVDLVFAEDRGEAVDRAEHDRVIGEAVRDRVRHHWAKLRSLAEGARIAAGRGGRAV